MRQTGLQKQSSRLTSCLEREESTRGLILEYSSPPVRGTTHKCNPAQISMFTRGDSILDLQQIPLSLICFVKSTLINTGHGENAANYLRYWADATYVSCDNFTTIGINTTIVTFYRAMHYSAKCGIAIAFACCPSVRPSVRPSVCPSVTLVDQDHIGWKSWKLTARTISPTPSLFVAQRTSTYSEGNIGKFVKAENNAKQCRV